MAGELRHKWVRGIIISSELQAPSFLFKFWIENSAHEMISRSHGYSTVLGKNVKWVTCWGYSSFRPLLVSVCLQWTSPGVKACPCTVVGASPGILPYSHALAVLLAQVGPALCACVCVHVCVHAGPVLPSSRECFTCFVLPSRRPFLSEQSSPLPWIYHLSWTT